MSERLHTDAAMSLESGISLVEASAGTGKTWSITQLVLRLLLDRKADGDYRVGGIEKILVVTFTNAATDELITRVRAMLREATDVFAGAITDRRGRESLFALRDRHGATEAHRLREALASLDRLAIFTIHGWSRRILEENALESGTPFGARFLEEEELITRRIAQDWWRRTIYEDEQLAAVAVQQDWKYDDFLRDLKRWQRLPDTQLDPDEDLPAARIPLARARAAFAASWNPAESAAFLDRLAWRTNAPLRDAVARARIIACGDALAAGRLSDGMPMVECCTSEAIRHDPNGIKKSPKDLFAAVSDQPFVQACDAIAAALRGLRLALRVSCLHEVKHRFAEEKRRRHMLGFDDLPRRLNKALRDGGSDGPLARAIRARYDAALIDEFQDTDPFQFPIFSTAFAGRPLFLIGDPKQAIYGFRGADLFAYMDAAEQAERHHTLDSNWRSSARMIGAVNSLFARRPNAFLYDRIAFTPARPARALADPVAGDGRGALHWWLLPPEQGKQLSKKDATARVHGALVREIERLLSTPCDDGAPLSPGRIAVLVRSGYEGLEAQEVLRAAGVPCIVSGLGDILRSGEMLELECLLRAVLEPAHASAVRAALATELWGLDAAQIHRLSDPQRESEWQGVIERLVAWRDAWMHHGFVRMAHEMLGDLRTSERLLCRRDGERRLTNLRHAVELLHGAVSEARLSPEGLLLWIAATRASGEEQAERTELRLETDAEAVQISTIHNSKGLEYDIVFCPGLWATRLAKSEEPVLVHLDEPAGAVVLDHGSPSRAARGRLAAAEELAEELRLVYVALTRARLRCYVAWGAVANSKTHVHAGHTALAYLLRESSEGGHPAEVAQRLPAEFEAQLASWDAPLRALVESSGGTMTVETLGGEQEPVVAWAGVAVSRGEPVCRTDLPPAESLQGWRVSSFTSLTAGSHADDARDVADAASGDGTLDRAPVVAAARDDFMSFPAGRQPGVALHELFERADFAAPAPELRALAAEIMGRFHLVDHDDRLTAVTAMAERVLGGAMAGASFALRDVPRDRTLREWTFHLPLGVVQRDLLADAFATHGGELARRYAPALRKLAADRTHGFLTGVVDLAFRHEDRWHVVDWKSNHLGADPAGYERAALEREMFASHYVLQYHLYLTALHRFLRARQPGYEYDRDVGGAWYAFLRGIDGSGRGWFHDRPPLALINALDAMMDDSAAIRAGAVQA